MTSATMADDRPTLRHTVPVDELARYAGLIGLVTAALAVAGFFATTAYLSAWHISSTLVRLDPLTAALRSDAVIVQSLVLAAIVFGIDVLVRRLEPRPRVRAAALAAVAAVLGLIVVDALRDGLWGPVLTVVGGVGLLVLHQSRRLMLRGAIIGFLVLTLLSAWQTGAEIGRLMRDSSTQLDSVTLTTRSEVGGLSGTESGSGWSYRGLYLVFRDAESLYVARVGEPDVWVIPAGNVMGVGIGW